MSMSSRMLGTVTAALAVAHFAVDAAPRFTCRPLADEATSAEASVAYAITINNRNQVLGGGFGTWQGVPSSGAMRWERDRIGHRILGSYQYVNDMNEDGWIVGSRIGETGTTRPMMWVDGQAIELGALPGADFGDARNINKRGIAVGYSAFHRDDGGPLFHATVWRNGKVHRLSGLTPKDATLASDINDDNVVVGYSGYPWAETPVIWKSRVPVELGAPPGSVHNYVAALNNTGIAVGASSDENSVMRATVWRDLEPTNIGGLPGYAYTVAYDVNDAGAIVGGADATYPAMPTAVYWASPSDAPARLDDLVDGGCIDAFGVRRQLSRARAINNRGVIVADAWRANWTPQAAFLLTPR